jgi:hypothetical protein
MHGEGACRPKQKSMVIVRSGERADGDEPIAAGTIFNDDRPAPARRETIGKQPRRDIGCARRPERDDEVHGAGRVGLRRRGGRAVKYRCTYEGYKEQKAAHRVLVGEGC